MKSYKLLLSILYLLIATGLLTVSLTGCCSNDADTEVSKELDIYENLEFEMPRVNEATFPDYSVNILDFGAVSDGYTDNSKAFSDAIDAVAANGGGKVIVPRGIFVTGPIIMKSHVNLHVEDGAVIRFSRNFDDYPLVETSFEGLKYLSLYVASFTPKILRILHLQAVVLLMVMEMHGGR